MTGLTTLQSRAVYAISIIVMSMVLSSGFAVWYVSYQNGKWCDVLDILTITDPSMQAPPTTDAGKQGRVTDIRTYESLVKLRKSFHCGDEQ